MNNVLLSPEFWFIIGIPITFLLGSLAHFAYDWSGKSVIVGIFTPVNESIWEHLKLSTYPTFIWYILGILIFRDKVNLYIWAICSVISVITSCIVITCFSIPTQVLLEYNHYFLTYFHYF